MKFKAPKGTRDFYPEDMALRQWIVERWHAVSRRNGFVEYDGPIFEQLELYRAKSGDEIVEQLFHFRDRGDRELAIRPEMTPTLARMVAARANALAKPIKWYSVPRLCRAEKPQRGRLREFFQWNIDIVGEEGEIADAECIFVLIDLFRELGLSPQQVQVRINSRALVTALLRSANIPQDKIPAVFAVLDKRDKLAAEAFAEMVAELGLNASQQQALAQMGDAKGEEGLQRIEQLLQDDDEGTLQCRTLRRVFALLNALGVAEFCTYDMGVVRGLAYYTGTVFEAFGLGGLRRAIYGGGRYDRLLSDVGGPPMAAVGFASSDVVIQDVLAEFGRLPDFHDQADFFVIDADASVFDSVLDVVGRLRAANVAALFSYSRQGVGKQFKQAAGKQARRVVIIEKDFPTTQAVSIKDMATGQQATISLDDLLTDPFQEIPADG